MTLLFKMERTLVTFSLALILKVRVPDIQTQKGTWYHKTFERLEKQKFTCELFDYLIAWGPISYYWRHKKR